MLSLFGIHIAMAGTPYVPADPDQILEHLPRQVFEASKSASAAKPTRLEAVNSAMTWISAAQSRGDARFLGYAQAALAPWLTQQAVASDVKLLHAVILQAGHEFDLAMTELNELLERDARNAQAWLTLATIHQVTGQPEAARRSCEQLQGRAGSLVVASCLAAATGMTDAAGEGYQALLAAFERNTTQDEAILSWSLMILADLAEQTGDLDTAAAALQAATEYSPNDIRPSLAYADYLLRHDQPGQVLKVLPKDESSLLVMLRRTLAAQQLQKPHSAQDADRLRQQFATAARRASGLHQREAAWAQLHLFSDPHAALELALENWARQREFADARLVLAAAIATDDASAARPVLDWLQSHRSTDLRLAPLVEQLADLEAQDAT